MKNENEQGTSLQNTEVAETVKTDSAANENAQESATAKEESNSEEPKPWVNLYPNNPDVIDLSGSNTTYTDALESISEAEEESSLPAIIGMERADAGRSRFRPAVNPNRDVVVLNFNPETTYVRLRRNSEKKSEGVTLTVIEFIRAFEKYLSGIPKKTQFTLVLGDNKTKLIGYLASENKIYFPIPFWPEDIAPPTPGYKLNVRVKALIIG
jgi:hypothetical protein